MWSSMCGLDISFCCLLTGAVPGRSLEAEPDEGVEPAPFPLEDSNAGIFGRLITVALALRGPPRKAVVGRDVFACAGLRVYIERVFRAELMHGLPSAFLVERIFSCARCSASWTCCTANSWSASFWACSSPQVANSKLLRLERRACSRCTLHSSLSPHSSSILATAAGLTCGCMATGASKAIPSRSCCCCCHTEWSRRRSSTRLWLMRTSSCSACRSSSLWRSPGGTGPGGRAIADLLGCCTPQ
mmetsp:Transcript_15919/g.44468  ORF Transcript_15919/g.44468 Transcript_15919/m.44468 type:complete len:244 (+) Transcript_15919:1386-2117(+)